MDSSHIWRTCKPARFGRLFLVVLAPVLVSLLVTAVGVALAEGPSHTCATPYLEFERSLVERVLQARIGEPTPPPGSPFTDPRHDVGDTMSFWAYDLSVMPPLWIKVPATCRAVGPNCYVFVDDGEWGVHMDQADVDLVVAAWEDSTPGDPAKGIFELNTETFGPPPDEIDMDPRIYIFYFDMGCFMGTCFDGYFSPLNELTEEEAVAQGGHSNEVEMFYMSCYPIDPTSPSTLSVLAHEFEHMIHWNMDINETTWVDEGCAEYAMHLYGHPDPILDFPSAPDDDLTEWDQQFADYVQTYLFFLYMAEQYGGAPMISVIVAEPANSILGIDNALVTMGHSDTFEEIFPDWAVANLLDDTTIYGGRYGYQEADLPPFLAVAVHTTYPASGGETVNKWATDYIRFKEGVGTLSLAFYGNDAFSFATRVVTKDTVNPTEVQVLTLDEYQDGSMELPGFGEDFDRTILVVCGTHASEPPAGYTYDAALLQASTPWAGTLAGETEGVLSCYPNPCTGDAGVSFQLPGVPDEVSSFSAAVYDVRGRLVSLLDEGSLTGGVAHFSWDGRNQSGDEVASGIYLVRVTDGHRELGSTKLVVSH